MHNSIRTLAIFTLTVLITVALVLFGIQTFAKNQETTDMQNAFQTALMTNRDDNARKKRGVFAVNKDAFEKDFIESTRTYGISKEMTRTFNNKILGLKVSKETEAYTYKSGNSTKKANADVYATDTLKVSFRYMDDKAHESMNLGGSTPIKAVRVLVSQREKTNDQWTRANVATYVVSTDVTTADNDISK